MSEQDYGGHVVQPTDGNVVRPARPDELDRLPEIERASGEAFRDVGMSEIADDDPMPVDVLARHRVWVAVDGADDPIAFAVAAVVDGCAHIELISVHPEHAHRGTGKRLLDHVERWAADEGHHALTLTTFRTVPWNAPYYERLGFRVLEPTELTAGLASVVADETARGLDPAARVCMRREIERR